MACSVESFPELNRFSRTSSENIVDLNEVDSPRIQIVCSFPLQGYLAHQKANAPWDPT